MAFLTRGISDAILDRNDPAAAQYGHPMGYDRWGRPRRRGLLYTGVYEVTSAIARSGKGKGKDKDKDKDKHQAVHDPAHPAHPAQPGQSSTTPTQSRGTPVQHDQHPHTDLKSYRSPPEDDEDSDEEAALAGVKKDRAAHTTRDEEDDDPNAPPPYVQHEGSSSHPTQSDIEHPETYPSHVTRSAPDRQPVATDPAAPSPPLDNNVTRGIPRVGMPLDPRLRGGPGFMGRGRFGMNDPYAMGDPYAYGPGYPVPGMGPGIGMGMDPYVGGYGYYDARPYGRLNRMDRRIARDESRLMRDEARAVRRGYY